MRTLRAAGLICGAFIAIGAAPAAAATLTITASPQALPAAGATVTATEAGHADRDGQLIVYVQPASSACQATSSDERNGYQGGPGVGTALNDRTNIGAGEDFSETARFTAQPGTSYRICGYLSGYDDSATPDVRADTPICAAGTHLTGNSCAADAAPAATGPALKITAPKSASRAFRPRLSWTSTDADNAVLMFAQPTSVACQKTSADERNFNSGHPHKGRVRKVYVNVFGGDRGRYSTSPVVKEAAGGRTRLCAYLVGEDDAAAPHKRASAVVG